MAYATQLPQGFPGSPSFAPGSLIQPQAFTATAPSFQAGRRPSADNRPNSKQQEWNIFEERKTTYSGYRGDCYGGWNRLASPELFPEQPRVVEVKTSNSSTVQVEFSPGENPLGLVLDYSMALPVIVDIVPESFAALRFTNKPGRVGLQPGCVLLTINRQREMERIQRGISDTRVGAEVPYLLTCSRQEIEELLDQRPLVLEFQAPMQSRFGDWRPQAWQQKSRERVQLLKILDAPKPGKYKRAPPQRALAMPPTPEENPDGTKKTFNQLYPARVPVTRYGKMDPAPYNWPTVWFSEQEKERKEAERQRLIAKLERRKQKVEAREKNKEVGNILSISMTKLPQIGDSSMQEDSLMDRSLSRSMSSTTLSQTFSRADGARATSPSEIVRSRRVGLSGDLAGSPSSKSGAGSKSGRPWSSGSRSTMYSPGEGNFYTAAENELRPPDQCYTKLLLMLEKDVDESIWYGPGMAKRVRMDHQEHYGCVPADMHLALKVSDAYEVGFRGNKREPPTAINIANYLAPPFRHSKPASVDDAPIQCDLCGMEGYNETTTLLPFFYCRKCKRNGNRYELCLPCFAVEILQLQGKHCDRDPHPHFLSCQHHSLVEMKDLRMAYPLYPCIRRIHCDHCGCLLHFRDKECTFYLCPQCPEIHGMRFELCEHCALDLRDRGHSMRKLLHAVGMPHR